MVVDSAQYNNSTDNCLLSRIKIQYCVKIIDDDIGFGVFKVMGSILNPVDGNSFVDLVKAKERGLLVDKTDFISKINLRLNTVGKLLSLTRPRRFGKTVTADMLLAYYSKEYDGKKIFEDLEISKKDNYEQYLNKYDVIYVDMNTINRLYDGYTIKKQKVEGVNDLVDYLEYSIIKDLREHEYYAKCLKKHQIENIGLLEALSNLRNDLNTQFVFIMDEWI